MTCFFKPLKPAWAVSVSSLKYSEQCINTINIKVDTYARVVVVKLTIIS